MGRANGSQAKRARSADIIALAPAAIGTPTETREDILATMARAVTSHNPSTAAEALRLLRLAYPHHPLALRLAALAVAMKRPHPRATLFA